MQKVSLLLITLGIAVSAPAQNTSELLAKLAEPHHYLLKPISSYDRSGGNQDYRKIYAGETLTIFDEPGPGSITPIWITINSPEQYHLKKLVLRAFWDGEATPSVEVPIGDFFGMGNGEYFMCKSLPLAVARLRLRSPFSPCPSLSVARSR